MRFKMTDAQSLHDESLVIDGLNPRELTAEDIDLLIEGGVDVVQNALVTGGASFTDAIDAIKRTKRTLDGVDNARQATTLADLTDNDDLKVVFCFQNSTPLERDRDVEGNLEVLTKLGVKTIQLTYNKRNYAGNGCSERCDDGLSDFGLDLIDAIESQGVLLDLSHTGPKTAEEAIEASSQPVIFSHSNAKAVHDHSRNISDELIAAAADTGGTVGAVSFGPAVSAREQSTIADYVDHIEHLVEVAGIDHVALGCDIGGSSWKTTSKDVLEDPRFGTDGGRRVKGLESPTGTPDVTRELASRGFTESEIHAILGENLLRVFRTVWT